MQTPERLADDDGPLNCKSLPFLPYLPTSLSPFHPSFEPSSCTMRLCEKVRTKPPVTLPSAMGVIAIPQAPSGSSSRGKRLAGSPGMLLNPLPLDSTLSTYNPELRHAGWLSNVIIESLIVYTKREDRFCYELSQTLDHFRLYNSSVFLSRSLVGRVSPSSLRL